MLDLLDQQGRQIGGLLDILVGLAQFVGRHGDQLGVATGFIRHVQNAYRAAGYDTTADDRVRRVHQHVQRVAVVGQRVGNIAVVAGVKHCRRHEAVDHDRAAVVIDLVLDRV